MQIVRFKTEANTSYGVLEGGVVVEYSGTPWSPFRRGRRRLPLKHAVLLAPTLPSKIIAVELNYRDRAAEMERRAPDEPRFFLKPTTTLVGPNDPIVYPPMSASVEYEAELAVVIKRRCRSVPAERVREYVLGYTYVNGGLCQSSSTTELIFPVEEIVARIAQVMTLLPGDVIATGTPAGVGPLAAGDRVEVRIEGIGSLRNTVVKL